MKKVFLHAGAPKTGTSAIQHALSGNRGLLRDHKYFYPATGMTSAGNHQPLIRSILGEPENPAHPAAAARFAQVVRAHPSHDVIVSAEYLSICLLRGPADTIFEFLRDLEREVVVVYYVRHLVQSLNSTYVEMIRSFRFHADLSVYTYERLSNIERYGRIQWRAEWPELITRHYTSEIKRHGIVADFLSTVGVPEDLRTRLGPEPRVNTSIGPIALAAARETRADIIERWQEPSTLQRGALHRTLDSLVASMQLEAPFQGFDKALSSEVRKRAAFLNMNPLFRIAEDFTELAGPNVFDPTNADLASLKHYQQMKSELWRAAREIMQNMALAVPAPWEKPPKWLTD